MERLVFCCGEEEKEKEGPGDVLYPSILLEQPNVDRYILNWSSSLLSYSAAQ